MTYFLGLLAAGVLWVCGKVRISKPVDYTMLQGGVRPPHWEEGLIPAWDLSLSSRGLKS